MSSLRGSDRLSEGIVDRICSHTKDLPSLYALSRTSRAFSQPALRKIWHSLDSFAPLLFTLPKDAVKCSVVKTEPFQIPKPKMLEITRELSDGDLIRFRHYAPFVHEVAPSSQPRHAVTLDAWKALERAKPGPLPNLGHVTMPARFEAEESTFPPVYFLLGRGLREVYLWPNGYFSDLEEQELNLTKLLASLPHTSPDISTMHLQVSPPAPRVRDHLTEGVRGLSNLVQLHVTGIPLSLSALSHLRSLPRLEILYIHVESVDFPEATPLPEPASANPFPSLESLTIDSDAASCVCRVLSYLSPPILAVLDISTSTLPSPSQFAAVSSAIASLPCRTSLRELIFRNYLGQPQPDGASIVLPPLSFAPLYSLPHIDTLRINGDCFASLDDAALAELARAWPRLQTLILCDRCAGSTGVTLSGLVDLVQHCKSLEEVHVPLGHIMRADCEAILSRPPIPGVCGYEGPCMIWSLNIGKPMIREEDVPAVAAVMSMLFPDLDSDWHMWHPSLSAEGMQRMMYLRWQEVMTAAGTFVSVRRQEYKGR